MALGNKHKSLLILRQLKARRSESSAFNFFKGCQNSLQPEWGCKIQKFEIPGDESDPLDDAESEPDAQAA